MNFLLKLHVDQVRLRAIGLPVRIVAAIAQQLHPVARLRTRHSPDGQVPDLSDSVVDL